MRLGRAAAWFRWILMLALVVALGLGAGTVAVQWLRPAVVVSQAVWGPVVQAFYATGTLQPLREYPVKSNVEGVLTEVLVDKGDPVRKGQKLATVYVGDLEFRYRQAEADLQLRKALADSKASPVLREIDDRLRAVSEELANAQRELKRVREQVERGAATASELEARQDQVIRLTGQADALRAQRATRELDLKKDLEVSQAALQIAKWNLDQQTITSPIDGTVLDRPLSVGTRLAVNAPIMTVADVSPDKLVMRSDVDEEDKTGVAIGQTVRMTLYAFGERAEPFVGKVLRIYPKADPTRRTFEVDVAVENPPAGFAAGMTGELVFILQSKDRALVIPSQAVQSSGVWTVRGGRLAKVDAKIGLRSIERAEVLSGLKEGDPVVISPIGSAKEDQSVRATWMDPIAAAGLNKPKTDSSSFKGFK
jgi:HlyD family secretion protein